MRSPSAALLRALSAIPAWPVGIASWDDDGAQAEGAQWLLPDAGPLPCIVTIVGDGDHTEALQHLVAHLRRCAESQKGQRARTIDGRVLVTHAYVRVSTTASDILHIENTWVALGDYEERRFAYLAVQWFDPNSINEGIL
jgi:hypothetical protein